jgi:hypothetical protein
MEDLTIYKAQETTRLSEADLKYLHECYEAIAETDKRIPVGTFLLKAVSKAMTQTKPEPAKVEESPLYMQVLANYESEKVAREDAERKLTDALNQLTERTRQLNEAGIVANNHILIDFSAKPDYKTYIENIMGIARKQNWASDMGELITRIISEFQALGYFKMTPEDIQELEKEKANE